MSSESGTAKSMRPSWKDVVLLAVLVIACVVGIVLAVRSFGHFVRERPAPVLLSAICCAVAAWVMRERFTSTTDVAFTTMIGWSLIGGIGGELLHELINGRASGESAVQWVIGPLGIGGAIGLGIGLLVGIVLRNIGVVVTLIPFRRRG
jgi:hypothetical protein